MTYDLNIDIARLLVDEPFFAAISRRVEKVQSLSIPTAGVGLDKETMQYIFIYNPNFMESLSDREKIGVIIHEFYHLIFRHVSNRRPALVILEPENYHKQWNIATDLSINSLIGKDNLPEMCCIPGGKSFEDFPSHESAEFYFRRILQIQEENESKGGGGEGQEGGGIDDSGQFDSHSQWAEGSGDGIEAETANERIKEYMKEAQEKAVSKGWGSISQSIRKEISKSLESFIDWKKVLRMFIGKTQRADKSNSRMKIDRRTQQYASSIGVASINPGRKINRIANIAVSIDQSGSVSNELMSMFFSELNGLAKHATFTVIPFDSQVFEDKIYVWEKGKAKKAERVLCGGTDFSAPTKYVNDKKFDGHIILTDMCAEKPIPSRCQRLWMTSQQYMENLYYDPRPRELLVVIKESKSK